MTSTGLSGWTRTAWILVLISLCVGPVLAAPIVAEFIAASTTELDNPHDVKLSPDGTELFVSDVGNNRVVILHPRTLAFIGSFGAGEQSGTHDVDFDAQGRAYVADTHNNRVLIYTKTGGQWRLTGRLEGDFRGPEGVLAHSNGRIYIAGAWSGNVLAFDNGRVVAELGGLSSPHDVEQTPDGDIWLSDAGNNRMLLLTPDLAVKRERKGPPFNFNGVRYQDVTADGTVIAADKYTHRVLVIAPDERVRLVLGTGSAGKGPNQFTTPEGVEIRGEHVWLSDSGNDRVVLYRLRGL